MSGSALATCCTAAGNAELMCWNCSAPGGLGKTLPPIPAMGSGRNDSAVWALHPLHIKCSQNLLLHIPILPRPSSTATHQPPTFVTSGLLLSFLLFQCEAGNTLLSERQTVTPSPSHLCIQERTALPWHRALQTNHVRRGESPPSYRPDLLPGDLRHPAFYKNGRFYQQIGLSWKQLFSPTS